MVAESVTVSVGIGAPGARARRCATGHAQLAAGGGRACARSRSAAAVGERDFQHAGAGAEDGERLRLAEHVDQPRADRAAGRGGGGDDAVGVGQQDAAAEGGGAGRQRALEQIARASASPLVRRGEPVEALRHEVGDVVDVVSGFGDGLAVWSSTCTTAPTPMVTRKAMISAGTARRSTGSAVSSRRYAGLAIDCASPLIESARADALAASARAMNPVPDWMIPDTTRPKRMCRIASESVAIRIDGD